MELDLEESFEMTETNAQVTHGDHLDIVVDGELRHYKATKQHDHKDDNDYHVHGHVTNLFGEESYDDILRRYHLDWEKITLHRRGGQNKYLMMIFLTFGFMITEFVVGIITQSVSLQADAFHMLSDVFALVVGFYSLKVAKWTHDERATFGYLRAEVIGAMINSVILLTSCFFISVEAIEKIVAVFQGETSELMQEPMHVLIVGSIGLVINLIGLFLFHQHGDNMNQHSVFLHILGDLLGSIGVVVAALVIQYTDSQYRYLTDPICSLFIVVLLARMSWRLLRGAIKIVLHLVPMDTDPTEIKNELMKIEGVISIHGFHLWSLDEKTQVASMHFATDQDPYRVIDAIKKVFHRFGIHYNTIQPEPVSRHHESKHVRGACSDIVCQEDDCVSSGLHQSKTIYPEPEISPEPQMAESDVV